jgi:predicted esterase
METMKFVQFQAEFFRLYSEKDYAGALALMDAHFERFKEQQTIMTNWRVCAAALNGDSDLALRYLQSALDGGFWFAPAALHGDPDLASLQGNPEYERMAGVCVERQEQALKMANPKLEVYSPQAKSASYPLILAMHPWGATAEAYARHYQFLTEKGWLVASAQSSQIAGNGLYVWDDADRGAAEVIAHFDDLKKQYPIDPQRVILSGFSQGAGLSVTLSVSRQISASGFIALGPYVEDIDSLAAALPAGPISGLRGYLLIGEHEPDHDMFEKIEALLKDHAVPYRRKNLEGLGHEIPDNFEELLENAIEFLAQQETE